MPVRSVSAASVYSVLPSGPVTKIEPSSRASSFAPLDDFISVNLRTVQVVPKRPAFSHSVILAGMFFSQVASSAVSVSVRARLLFSVSALRSFQAFVASARTERTLAISSARAAMAALTSGGSFSRNDSSEAVLPGGGDLRSVRREPDRLDPV